MVGVRGVQLGYMSTNGVTLHVATAGPEDGPLVVLLHGFPELWWAWRGYIPALAEAGFRVLAPDQRGYNLSDKPARVEDYALDTLAQDVVGLIEAAGRKTACVVGHDWGAAVAWWTAMRHPDRVSAVSALNVPHPEVLRRTLLTRSEGVGTRLEQARRSWYMFFFQLPVLPERALLRQGGRALFSRMAAIGRPGAFDEADLPVYQAAWSQPGAARAMVDWYRAVLRTSLGPPPEDPRVHVPAQIIWGRQDALLSPELVPATVALCDDVRVEWFDEATHWVQHEEPERVQAVLLEFLGSHTGQGAGG